MKGLHNKDSEKDLKIEAVISSTAVTLDDADGNVNDSKSENISDKNNISITDVEESETHVNLAKKIQVKEGNFFIKLIIGKEPKPLVQETGCYPMLNTNIFQFLTFTWISDIIKRGYLRRIEDEDLYKLDGKLSVTSMTEEFERHLETRIAQWQQKHPESPKYDKWVIIKALNDTYKTQFWLVGGIAKITSDLLQVLMPLLVKALVKHIQQKQLSGHKGKTADAIGYCLGIALMLIGNSIAAAIFFHGGMLTGAQVKAVLTNVIYKKSFSISSKARFEFPNGKVNSLVMADISRIDFAVGTFHFLWSFPIGFGVGVIILCITLGPVALLGVGVILLVLVFVFAVNKQLKKWRRGSLVYIDKRVRAINEIVNNLKMIKFYCWEAPYYAIVEGFRNSEKKYILKMQIWKSHMNALISSSTYLAVMATFLVLFYTSDNFQAYNIFSSITLLNVLRMPLNLLPIASASCVDALLAMDRVSDFLQAEEGEEIVEKLPLEESKNSVEIAHGTFQWDVEEAEQETKPKSKSVSKKDKLQKIPPVVSEKKEGDDDDLGFPGLLDINLTVKKGEFIIVTGSIGTGKTSLLNAISGSMRRRAGDLRVFGTLTFCSYPWVQNATIRDNIIFGQAYDERKYQEIVKACALEVDFKILPEGDQTEVGERGITLSGGQKARINLARAVYSDKDIILLDDVLSAVDARVGRHIMTECIEGLLKNKTRILATHQLSLVGSADRVAVLDGSGTIEVGTHQELLEKSQTFATLMEYSSDDTSTAKENDEAEGEEGELNEIEKVELERLKSQITKIKTNIDEEQAEESENQKLGPGSTEARSVNSISLLLYTSYLELGSGMNKWIVAPLFLLGLAANGFLQVWHSVWLSFWISDKFGYQSGVYAGLYAAFVMMATGSYFALFSMMAWINNNAGLRLFNLSSAKLLKAPLWFMDITPIGRILNRFTKDVDVLDTDIIEQLRIFLTCGSLIGAVLILCGIYIPWFFIVIPFCFLVYYLLSSYYKTSALDLKRLEATNRSYVFSHFNESLSGMKVIKSYDSRRRFQDRFEYLIDNMNSAGFLTMANQRWLAIRLDLVSGLITLFVSLMCVCGGFNLGGSSSGLLVSYIIQVASIISLTLRSMTQLENDFNSVERLFEYAKDLPQEASYDVPETKPDEQWPVQGSIEFNNVSLSYREGLPLVLKNISFRVQAGEKIGICGRTGAGKSTIMNALYRISELATGNIIIDDVDITNIGLKDLRSKLSIIPQDPVLFHGTIRQNLDPFNNATDAELWSALRRSGLVGEGAAGLTEFNLSTDNLRSFHKFHLDQLVEDDGANFSLGERQLLALARALVRNSKILILDEATSSVDYETDAMIQSTIVNEFKECTILCIAHRLKTILQYDKILVLDKGEVREFGTPFDLFKDGGIFTEMCERSNINELDFLNQGNVNT